VIVIAWVAKFCCALCDESTFGRPVKRRAPNAAASRQKAKRNGRIQLSETLKLRGAALRRWSGGREEPKGAGASSRLALRLTESVVHARLVFGLGVGHPRCRRACACCFRIVGFQAVHVELYQRGKPLAGLPPAGRGNEVRSLGQGQGLGVCLLGQGARSASICRGAGQDREG
jgi:hypothetical protein